jgi:hypothetical protein
MTTSTPDPLVPLDSIGSLDPVDLSLPTKSELNNSRPTTLAEFNNSRPATLAELTVPMLIPVQADSFRRDRLKEICNRHEICGLFADKLIQLEGFDIVIVADDSGSMNDPAGSIQIAGVANPYGAMATRWNELQRTSEKIIDIASTMSTHGVDVYFLNRPPVLGVILHTQLEKVFKVKPAGSTPIVPVLKKIFSQPPRYGKKRLVILMTDGRPTGPDGRGDDVAAFKACLMYDRQSYDYVNIIACTDDDATMSYLNNWDDTLPRLDVIDDYGSEYKEVKRVQGRNFPFSYGDYVVKSMLGSVDPWFDHLDEINHATGLRVYREDDRCCIIL